MKLKKLYINKELKNRKKSPNSSTFIGLKTRMLRKLDAVYKESFLSTVLLNIVIYNIYGQNTALRIVIIVRSSSPKKRRHFNVDPSIVRLSHWFRMWFWLMAKNRASGSSVTLKGDVPFLVYIFSTFCFGHRIFQSP